MSARVTVGGVTPPDDRFVGALDTSSTWWVHWAPITAEMAVKWAEWHVAEAAWWADRGDDETAGEYRAEAAYWAGQAERAAVEAGTR